MHFRATKFFDLRFIRNNRETNCKKQTHMNYFVQLCLSGQQKICATVKCSLFRLRRETWILARNNSSAKVTSFRNNFDLITIKNKQFDNRTWITRNQCFRLIVRCLELKFIVVYYATLHPALSVHPSVGRSVGHTYIFLWILFFDLTAPTKMV